MPPLVLMRVDTRLLYNDGSYMAYGRATAGSAAPVSENASEALSRRGLVLYC